MFIDIKTDVFNAQNQSVAFKEHTRKMIFSFKKPAKGKGTFNVLTESMKYNANETLIKRGLEKGLYYLVWAYLALMLNEEKTSDRLT